MTARKRKQFIPCVSVSLPAELLLAAAACAIEQNPANAPPVEFACTAGIAPEPLYAAVLTAKMWPASGVSLTVGFPFDNPSQELRTRILSHFNAWGQSANVKFFESNTSPQIRVARTPRRGYSSYVGTDNLMIPWNEPTMNLDSFTMQTPDSEFYRVVRHECGHALGFPHEHMRRDIVARLDPQKTVAYFQRTQGWSPDMTRQQVLTPLEDTSILGTPTADQTSIMCYQLPASITRDGKPVVGGMDINASDHAFAGKLYPLPVAPPPPPPVGGLITLDPVNKTYSFPPEWKLK